MIVQEMGRYGKHNQNKRNRGRRYQLEIGFLKRLEYCGISFSPFEMYGEISLTSSEYAGGGNGEVRAGRIPNGHVIISIPTERMAQIAVGVFGTTDFEGNFTSACRADISGHFSQPVYAILRPTEFRGDLRKNGNRNVDGALVVALGNLV